MRHLGEALDQARKSEYGDLRLKAGASSGAEVHVAVAPGELETKSRQALKALLRANKRLNSAYLLKESFGQLWSYEREGWARRFFENWKAALKWQRLRPYEKFAEMIERHWDGVAAYSRSENKVSLGFVEGLNNKIRVIKDARTVFETKNICVLRYSLRCCQSCKII